MDVFRALDLAVDFGSRPRLRKPMHFGMGIRGRHAFLPKLPCAALIVAAKKQSKLKQTLDSLVAFCIAARLAVRSLGKQNFDSHVFLANSFDGILIRDVENDDQSLRVFRRRMLGDDGRKDREDNPDSKKYYSVW